MTIVASRDNETFPPEHYTNVYNKEHKTYYIRADLITDDIAIIILNSAELKVLRRLHEYIIACITLI